MKYKVVIIFLLAFFASCGREDLKDDLTLPELPPAGNKITIDEPNSSRIYESGKILYIAWQGLSLEEVIRMDLYKDSSFVSILQTRSGVDSTLCRIPDSLTTSSHYMVKVYEENDPGAFGFSEEFTINGLPEDDSSSTPPIEQIQ